jgi:hypothetical protein
MSYSILRFELINMIPRPSIVLIIKPPENHPKATGIRSIGSQTRIPAYQHLTSNSKGKVFVRGNHA